jgi:NAD-dependent deacetylase
VIIISNLIEEIEQAVSIIKGSHHTTAFTGAGISVESGIPPFRGKNGLWEKYDPTFLNLDYFYRKPLDSWKLNQEIFYDFFGQARPNKAHQVLANLEAKGFIKTIITQNIDNLHQKAGSRNVLEFHGTSRSLTCIKCGEKYGFREELLDQLPPRCEKCNGILKPDYIFFGEPIPEPARTLSFREAELADVFLIIGTTGEIQPASLIPYQARNNGVKIIEINTRRSTFTETITDIFLEGPATELMRELESRLCYEK